MNSSPRTRVACGGQSYGGEPRLLEEVRRRGEEGPCAFTLLIPDATDRAAADWTLESALPLLRRAAKTPVDSRVGGPDPFEAIQAAVKDGDFDEIIISTLSKRTSKWLRRDLIHRVETLGLPVKAVTPRSSGKDVSALETVAGKGGAAGGMLG